MGVEQISLFPERRILTEILPMITDGITKGIARAVPEVIMLVHVVKMFLLSMLLWLPSVLLVMELNHTRWQI